MVWQEYETKTIHVHLTEIISHMEHLLQFLDYESSVSPGIILCMRPANERRRYTVTPPVIGWAHTQNDPWSLAPYIQLPQGAN